MMHPDALLPHSFALSRASCQPNYAFKAPHYSPVCFDFSLFFKPLFSQIGQRAILVKD